MHQTFYIDTDEEISSVIDRLNRSMSKVNYFVLPKRAIFLLSIINLKLLKSEAEKNGKKLIIVTQDEVGASMAERAGLEVKRTIDDIESKERFSAMQQEDLIEEDIIEEKEDFSDELQNKKNRLKGVGTNNFYVDSDDFEKKISKSAHMEKLQTKGAKINSVFDMKNSSRNSTQKAMLHSARTASDIHGKMLNNSKDAFSVGTMDNEKTKTLEKMYSSLSSKKKDNNTEKVSVVSGLSKKIFVVFISLCLVLFIFVAGYLFLPSAKVVITPNDFSEKVDVVLQGSLDQNLDGQNNFRIRAIENEKELTLPYVIQAGQSGSGKKAHGNIVIYNEFSSLPQTLVATTRLESSDGKIFRLMKNVIVPGTSLVGGQTKPGAIEAEIIADQPGENFNLEPSSFKIPGFKDGPKYEKFSAKSTEKFIGGSLESDGTLNLISQKDIDNAKQQSEKAITEELKKNVRDELIENELILDQSEKISITKSFTTAKVGSAVDKFDYFVSAKIKTIVFKEDDIKKILIQEFKKRPEMKDVNFEVSKMEYGLSIADFEKNTLELKVRGDFLITENIDIEKIKKELLGKKDGQIDEVIKNNKGIKNANIEFSIPFVSQIPQYASRVSFEIKKESLE